jgi:hypothetical protein
VLLVLFTVATIRSELRGRRAGDYGRLLSRGLPEQTAPRPPEIVTEAPSLVQDETSADPMLVGPAARAQYLGDTTLAPLLTTQTTTDFQQREPLLGQGNDRLVIVGGLEGVAIVREEGPRRPKLGGGFGKP